MKSFSKGFFVGVLVFLIINFVWGSYVSYLTYSKTKEWVEKRVGTWHDPNIPEDSVNLSIAKALQKEYGADSLLITDISPASKTYDYYVSGVKGTKECVGDYRVKKVKFNKGEKKNAEDLSKKYAALCDVFVMDAFGTAHRAQATTYGVAQFAPVACAGPLLAAELEALGKVMDNPARPMVAIVGGSKVSTKLTVLDTLSKVCDQLIVGGGIANTFIAAAGNKVGKSLCEEDLIPNAKELASKTQLPEFVDVVVGKEFDEKTPAVTKDLKDIADDDMIFDLGPKSMANINKVIKEAKTILWNGPVGVFEFEQFAAGTKSMSQAIAESAAFSVAGGGDTINAIQKFNVADKISYISTGGGAFLEFVEGKKLPAVEILEKRAAE